MLTQYCFQRILPFSKALERSSKSYFLNHTLKYKFSSRFSVMIGYCSKSFPNMEEIMHDGPWRTYQVVVAATCNMGIGKDGKLPWRLPSDLKFFKELTVTASGPDKMNAVVMGRKTWESIPLQFRPLPGRLNVVLTRSGSFDVPSAENIVVSACLPSALK